MSHLSDIVSPQDQITIVDLGASLFDTTANSYDALKQYRTKIIGFEPNVAEYQKLVSLTDPASDAVRYLPYAIADGREHTLTMCALPGCTSILEPNQTNAANYVAFAAPLEVVDRVQISTKKLDEVTEIEKFDYLKVDIQGAELLALQNASRKLKNSLVIECEVEFIDQYKNQPRFSEIEIYLRSVGFQFHRFNGYGTRTLSPMVINNDPYTTGNQWLWSDAIFIRDINSWNDLCDDALKKVAIIMHECYSSYDFSYRALQIVDRRNNIRLADKYAKFIKEKLNISLTVDI